MTEENKLQSTTVAEFTRKPYKKYSCKQIKTAQNNLVKAFRGTKPENEAAERALFKKVILGLNQSEKGKETLVELGKLGYDFFFDVGDFGGYCSHTEKKIALNPECGIAYMQGMAIHEGRHAIQKKYERTLPEHHEMDSASVMKFHRAKEADATAHEAAFIYQMKEINKDNFDYEMNKSKREPILAYVHEMERSGDEKKAMQESFKAWYTSEFYNNHYDPEHKGFIKSYVNWGIKYEDAEFLSKSVSDKEVANICRYNEETYMPENFFSSEQAFSIPLKDKKYILKQTKKYATVVGKTPDMSVMKMSDRAEKPSEKEKKTSLNAAAVAAKKKQASRG